MVAVGAVLTWALVRRTGGQEHLSRRSIPSTGSSATGSTSSAGGGECAAARLNRGVLPNVEELATVVVCEDDDPTRELLCDHLTADRYRALPAPSASDALRLCGYNQPDLMVLDLGLPDAPGIDVLREIRAAGERFDPELPVLVLSGRSSEADRLRGFEAGADDYLDEALPLSGAARPRRRRASPAPERAARTRSGSAS